MAQNSETIQPKMAYKAEGSPDDRERREPLSALRTSTVPAVQESASSMPNSDTGVNMTVRLNVEGSDNNEAQDSSLTKEETKASSKGSAPVAEIEAESTETQKDSKVLIVEDSVELGEVIEATLKGIGLQAHHETRGKSGVDKLKDFNPDVVVMDIGLPDITGWKMLDLIKEHYTTVGKEMPQIIVITAFGDPANRLIGKLQNIHSYLIKPFTPDEVERLVKMALAGEQPENNGLDGEESAAG